MHKSLISSTKLLKVKIDHLRLRAYIGYLDWEKEKLQDLVISFSFKYDAEQADDVAYAPDYKHLTKLIISLVDNQSFHLIETLADKIYQTIAGFNETIQAIKVVVEKPHALRFADNVKVKISGKDRLHRALIALGSNIDAEENMTKVIGYLRELGTIENQTACICTKPLKFEAQPDFLNAALLLHTNLPLIQLQARLKQIELKMGRVRTVNKNAPRVIDLDVITFNGRIIDTKDMVELPFLAGFVKELQPEIFTRE